MAANFLVWKAVLKVFRQTVLAVCVVFTLTLWCPQTQAKHKMNKRVFGTTASGEEVDLYVLTNNHGVEAVISTFGGALVSLKLPDRNGRLEDVVLGYDTLDGYVNDTAYFGGIIGRYANRIAHGKFKLDGSTYTLLRNNGENSLHGGSRGFNKVLWQAKDVSTGELQALQLKYVSRNGEEGYPGTLSVQVVYSLTESNELRIDYSATTDKETVVNLTHHSYFNLAGPVNRDILQHEVTLFADRFTPVDASLIPTGELRSVQGTPFGFRHSTAIGARIGQDDAQLQFGKGYDHNWVFNGAPGLLSEAARVHEPKSRRILEIWTTEPGLQFYSGNFLNRSIRGKSGKVYGYRSGFCLEPQHYPDSPNQPSFPSTVLKPGDHYQSTTLFRFFHEVIIASHGPEPFRKMFLWVAS